MKPWYEELFTDYAETYDKEVFTQGTLGGCDFIEKEIGSDRSIRILEGAARAVKPGRKFILTTLCALFPLNHSVKEFEAENLAEGTSDDHAFDPMTFRMKSTFQVRDDHGREKTLSCDERYYAPSEITWLLKSLGFTAISVVRSSGLPVGWPHPRHPRREADSARARRAGSAHPRRRR